MKKTDPYRKERMTKMKIDKEEFEREEVLEKLLTYFESKVLESGYKCEVYPMTLVFTAFQIKKL